MSDPRSDAELSRAVAVACGWKLEDACVASHSEKEPHYDNRCKPGRCWRKPDATVHHDPHFATSLDACFGPDGPVELAKAKPAEFQDDYCTRLELLRRVRDGHDLWRWPELYLTPRDYCLAFLAAVETRESPAGESGAGVGAES